MKINRKEVIIVTACPFCGHANEIAVNEEDYFEWDDGALVKDVFPYLDKYEREALITGICRKCLERDFTPTPPNEENEDELDEFEEWDDDVDECGYNPYMGCYDFDC